MTETAEIIEDLNGVVADAQGVCVYVCVCKHVCIEFVYLIYEFLSLLLLFNVHRSTSVGA